nr:Werner syndrome-like exonuclease [Tanacetum cinerariifolium]
MEDLRLLAAATYRVRELSNAGIKKLTSRVLKREINKPKKITMSGWDSEWLTPAQVQYACLDAFLSFEIARVLMKL